MNDCEMRHLYYCTDALQIASARDVVFARRLFVCLSVCQQLQIKAVDWIFMKILREMCV